MIPEAAVEAAARLLYERERYATSLDDAPAHRKHRYLDEAERLLEAAAPHILSHEREETRLAHVDAVVNAETVGQLQEKLDRVEALADKWWANFPSKARAVMEAIKD